MIIQRNVTLYKCEHCRKAYQRKHFAEKHEKYCSKNPNNQHKCWFCKHLKRKVGEFINEGLFGDMYYPYTDFECTLLNKKLYSFKAERIGEHSKIMFDYTEDAERMPLECDHYEMQINEPYPANENIGEFYLDN